MYCAPFAYKYDVGPGCSAEAETSNQLQYLSPPSDIESLGHAESCLCVVHMGAVQRRVLSVPGNR